MGKSMDTFAHEPKRSTMIISAPTAWQDECLALMAEALMRLGSYYNTRESSVLTNVPPKSATQ